MSQAYVTGGELGASATLIGIGLNAVRSYCKDNCESLEPETIEAVNAIKDSLGSDIIVDSSSKAVFSDSHMVLPGKLLDDAFWNANGDELTKSFGWTRSPLSYDPAVDGIY